MKRVLILGAGMVVRPMVKYLLGKNFHVTIASRTREKADKLINGHPNGLTISWTVDQKEMLDALIKQHDIVVSLLPYAHHVIVAKRCIHFRKDLVTTSYVKHEMQALDEEAKKAGIILASKDAVALDIAASKIMEFNPKKEVPAIRMAVKRGLYNGYDFELVGIKKLPQIHFRKPTKGKTVSKIRKMLKGERPIVCDVKKCIKCGTCAKHCPAKAIILKPYPVIDKRKCIRCFCCMEVCPVNALSLGEIGDEMWQNTKKC